MGACVTSLLEMGLDSQDPIIHTKYVKDWKFQMEEAHRILVTRNSHGKKRHKSKHPMLSQLIPGNTVLVRKAVH